MEEKLRGGCSAETSEGRNRCERNDTVTNVGLNNITNNTVIRPTCATTGVRKITTEVGLGLCATTDSSGAKEDSLKMDFEGDKGNFIHSNGFRGMSTHSRGSNPTPDSSWVGLNRYQPSPSYHSREVSEQENSHCISTGTSCGSNASTNNMSNVRPSSIRTQTHHRSKYGHRPNHEEDLSMASEISHGYRNSELQSPHGSTSDSGVSSQRSSISRHNIETSRDNGYLNNGNFGLYDQFSQMRHYPRMNRSVTPDTVTMTDARYDYDTASLPRGSYGRTVRKLPFSATQRPLRSSSQIDVAPRDGSYSGMQHFEILPHKYTPHQYSASQSGDSASNLLSMSRTKESLQSSQESIMTYAEGYGYGAPSLHGKAVIDRTSSFNSDMHQLQSPSSASRLRYHSPGTGLNHSLHQKGLKTGQQYASTPVVNTQGSYTSETPDHASLKSSQVDSIAEEEEEDQTTVTPKKSKKGVPSLKVFNALVQKMTGQIKSMEDTKSSSQQNCQSNAKLSFSPSPKYHETFTGPSGHSSKQVPALVGLKNHGNTCFMNSIVQCLSNTNRLAEYFVVGKYKEDLIKVRKNKNRKFGTKGELTEYFANLLQALWSLKYSAHHTEDFRRIVGKYASQYKGDDQHDAQEFLIWLLDNVHEDLNSGSSKKKYKQIKNSHNKPDELLAAESQANYLRHNSSFIHDIFHAQFRSSLKCLNCGQQSSTFEPFLCVSLPIPQRTTRVVTVVVAFITGEPRVIKMAVKVEAGGRVAELRGEVARQCRIAVTRLVLCEIYMDGFYRCFSDQQPLSDIRDEDSIYGIEIPNNSYSAMTSSQVRPYIHGVYHGQPIKEPVTLVVVNQIGYGKIGRRFGQPMAIEIDRNVNFNQLKVVLLKAMGCNCIEEVMARNCSLRIGVCSDQNGTRSVLTSQSSRPLYHHIISSMLQLTVSRGEPPHIKAVVEWREDITHLFSSRSVDVHVAEHEDYRRLKSSHSKPVHATLQECLDVFTQEEKLAADNAWQCMNCRKPQQCTKKLSLWSLPDILVIHLKRFKQTSVSRQKLSTMVEFPINGLDLSCYVEQNQNQNNQAGSQMRINLINNLTKWSQWRPNSRRPSTTSQGQDCVYDLHAVCNHVGSLSGGHYTAYCKNPTNRIWYHFDDTKITVASEESVVSKAAYLLFYHKRNSGRALSGDEHDHWFMYKDYQSHPQDKTDSPPQSPIPELPVGSPTGQRITNGFSSLRLHEVRKNRSSDGRGTWNARMLHSQDSLDSGIVISNGQADHEGQRSNLQGDVHVRENDIAADDGGFTSRPFVRGITDTSGRIVQAGDYSSVPESRI